MSKSLLPKAGAIVLAIVALGLGCSEPCPTCFCDSVDGGPFDEKGLDVLLYDLEDGFLVRALTEKGEELLGKAKGGTSADQKAKKRAEEIAAAAAEKLSSNVPTDKLSDKVVNEIFDAPFWEEHPG